MAYALLHEEEPGLLPDRARAMGVQLRSGGPYYAHKSQQWVREAHTSNSTRVADADSPRLTELRILPKDPAKGIIKNLSATGSNSVIEILLSYGLHTKHNKWPSRSEKR